MNELVPFVSGAYVPDTGQCPEVDPEVNMPEPVRCHRNTGHPGPHEWFSHTWVTVRS